MQYLQPGTFLKGRTYKIVRFISSGGFGNTYEALDVNLDKRVAIKEFFVKDFCSRESDTTLVTIASTAKKPLIEHLKKKFIEEARAIAKMEHENIVKVQALFEENGTAYYVMDYIDGESLSTLLKRRGSLPEKEALPIILKVADALGYMHKQNRFHLDVKPANIMLRNDGKVILIDFGSSKQYAEVDGENTTTLAPCYTPGYAPSEQMNPKPTAFTAASDVYSLGATLYKILTGQTPPSAIDLMSGEEKLLSLSDEISTNVRECLKKAMIPQRNKRLQSIKEFITLLNIVDIEKPILNGKREKKVGRKKRKRRRKLNGFTFIVIGSILLFVIGATLFIISHNSEVSSQEDLVNKVSYNDEILKINEVTYKMIRVEGGTFLMGSNTLPEYRFSNEQPVHNVTLSSFMIGETEVTQGLWKAVMGSSRSLYKGDDLPMVFISWNDCKEFIYRLDSITGRNFRLPTEAEWEYAARGGLYSKNTLYSGSSEPDECGWYSLAYDTLGVEVGPDKPSPVAKKIPNELGIYDMSGNVWEWCEDRYGPYNDIAETNPLGPTNGSDRVIRGGSWAQSPIACRVTCRGFYRPTDRQPIIGFRLALSE